MTSLISNLSNSSELTPLWQSGEWTGAHGWLHIISDVMIFGAFAAIPLALIYNNRRRADIPFAPVLGLLLGSLIFCGISYLVEAALFWKPWHRFSGVLKAVTAVLSWLTILALVRAIPGVLFRPGKAENASDLNENIAVRLQSEEALRKSEEFIRTVIQSNPDGVKVLDTAGGLLLLNESGLGLLESDNEADYLGKKWWDIWPPEAREKVKQSFHDAKNGKTVRFEEFRPTAKGTPKWWDVQISPVRNNDGSVESLVVVSHDISERKNAEAELKQSEASYRSLFESPGVGRVEADAHTNQFVRVNQYYCELTGYTEKELLSGMNVFDVTHPNDLEIHNQKFAPLLNGEANSVEIEKRYIRKDGASIWVSVSITAISDAEGNAKTLSATVLNISERKKTEERLRILESAVQKMNDVVIITEAEPVELPGPRIIYVNPAFTEETGFTEEEAIGQTPRILQGPKTDRAVLARIKSHLKRWKPVSVELTNYRKDKTTFDVEFTVFPVADENGWFTHWVSVQRDITERKRNEIALRQNAGLFSTIINQAPGGVYVVDADFRLVQVNDRALPTFKNVDPLIGRDFNEVMEILWGEEVGKQCADIFRHTLETGESFVSERFTEVRSDIKTEQSYEWETRQITLPDGQHGVVCYFEEVTERIREEEERRANAHRMRIATEATQVGIWEWNVITNEIIWDSQLFRIYGMEPTPDKTMHYEEWRKTVLPEDLEMTEAILLETVRTCGQQTREFRIRRQDDGKCRFIRSVETVRANADGVAEWVVGTNLDITDQKLAEQAILDETKRKDEFLAMLGHELRNPLNAIRHAVEISRETPADDESRSWAHQVIDRQSKQLTRMVDDLLDVARINQGRIELRHEALELGEVLDRATSVIQPFLKQRKHRFEVKIERPLDTTGDADRLEQVFVNLLNNAVKYTPEGGLIKLIAKRSDEEIIISIIDSGVGISPELLPHVCDLFRQADSSLDRSEGGLGIGLSVVKSLLEMHSGQISIESRGTDRGTTVKVRLPAESHRATPSPANHLAPDPDTSDSALRILIVDDHEDAAQGMERLLKRRNYEVELAYSGPQGFEKALEFRPEVLLLDLGLPGFDGYELVKKLREEATVNNAYFIAISGYAQGGDREQCLREGFDEHFAKPVDFQQLLATIRERPTK